MEIRQETDIKVRIRKTLFEIEQQKRTRVQRFLLEIGLTPGQGQARILSSLAAAGNVTQRELADACLMDVTTMSRTLDRLEEKGLIRRERDPQSRRAYRVGLTDAGRETAEKVDAGFAELEQILCGGMTDGELLALAGSLRKIRGNLNE